MEYNAPQSGKSSPNRSNATTNNQQPISPPYSYSHHNHTNCNPRTTIHDHHRSHTALPHPCTSYIPVSDLLSSPHPYNLPATTHTMPSHPSLHLRQFTAIPSHASGISPARPTTNRPNSQSRPHDTCLPHTGAQGWRSQYLSVLVQVHLQRLHVVFEP
jgi:hypothetical protein